MTDLILAILKWRKAVCADAAFLPPQAEVRRLRPFVHGQVALLAVVLACTAVMARFGAF